MKTPFKKLDKIMQPIMVEMCRRVGVDHLKIDYGSPGWFTAYQWTEAEEKDFLKWLTAFVKKAHKVPAHRAEREANKLNMCIGWKTKS